MIMTIFQCATRRRARRCRPHGGSAARSRGMRARARGRAGGTRAAAGARSTGGTSTARRTGAGTQTSGPSRRAGSPPEEPLSGQGRGRHVRRRPAQLRPLPRPAARPRPRGARDGKGGDDGRPRRGRHARKARRRARRGSHVRRRPRGRRVPRPDDGGQGRGAQGAHTRHRGRVRQAGIRRAADRIRRAADGRIECVIRPGLSPPPLPTHKSERGMREFVRDRGSSPMLVSAPGRRRHSDGRGAAIRGSTRT